MAYFFFSNKAMNSLIMMKEISKTVKNVEKYSPKICGYGSTFRKKYEWVRIKRDFQQDIYFSRIFSILKSARQGFQSLNDDRNKQ